MFTILYLKSSLWLGKIYLIKRKFRLYEIDINLEYT